MRRWSLRTRVMIAFGVGAVAVSAVFAVVTAVLVRNYLLEQRQVNAVRLASSNARVVESSLQRSDGGLAELLTGLTASPQSAVLVRQGPDWISSGTGNDRIVPSELPADVVAAVDRGATARRRVTIDGSPALVVGLPMREVPAVYVQVFSLRQLDSFFHVLTELLATATVLSGLLGATAGRWVAGRALRPLDEATGAAAHVAAGDLAVRLPDRADPDLGPLAAAFNDMTETLQRRIARDARFAGDVSHELRSPITTMLNALAVLRRRRDELPDGARQAVDLLDTDLSRFRVTIDDLLEMSRGDQGRALLHTEQVDLVGLVDQATRALRGTVPVEQQGRQPHIVGDRRRLERVLVNLVDNADRHGGGLVRLAVCARDGTARVEVDDAGPGVRTTDRERIFERFARGPAAERGADDVGTGLGLALAAQHMELHGGSLSVEDRPGGGARFVLELPEVCP